MLTTFTKMDQRLIVFGVEGGQAERLRELPGYVLQRVIDPAALARILAALSDRTMPDGLGADIAGIVFDLTALPRGHRRGLSTDDAGSGAWDRALQSQETRLAWFCSGLLVCLPYLSDLTVVIVSHDSVFAATLRAYGVSPVAHLNPDEDDMAWRFALEKVLAVNSSGRFGPSNPHAPDPRGRWHGTRQIDDATVPRAALHLHAHAWIDLVRCLIWMGNHPVALTGREVRVLEILARSPGRFHTACDIAQEIIPTSFDIGAHCIEQTISGLRHKLGETARAPRAIVSRRGLGYALVTSSAQRPRGAWRSSIEP